MADNDNLRNKQSPAGTFLGKRAALRGLLAAATLVAVGALAAAPPASTAGGPSIQKRLPARNPDTCVPNTAWRLTTGDDFVCVDSDRQAQVNFETWYGNLFMRDSSTDNGCKAGYVRREAVPGDAVCVTPAARDQARKDSELAPTHWEATADRFIWGNYVPHPFGFPGARYVITSGYARAADGRQPLNAYVYLGSYIDGASLLLWDPKARGDGKKFIFKTPRTRSGSAYHNRFEIVATHSEKCLDVLGYGTHDGARVVQWDCHGGPNQLWYLERRADNQWQIRNYHSDKCLDAHNPTTHKPPEQGTWLQQWTCLGNVNQAWKLLRVGP